MLGQRAPVDAADGSHAPSSSPRPAVLPHQPQHSRRNAPLAPSPVDLTKGTNLLLCLSWEGLLRWRAMQPCQLSWCS